MWNNLVQLLWIEVNKSSGKFAMLSDPSLPLNLLLCQMPRGRVQNKIRRWAELPCDDAWPPIIPPEHEQTNLTVASDTTVGSWRFSRCYQVALPKTNNTIYIIWSKIIKPRNVASPFCPVWWGGGWQVQLAIEKSRYLLSCRFHFGATFVLFRISCLDWQTYHTKRNPVKKLLNFNMLSYFYTFTKK